MSYAIFKEEVNRLINKTRTDGGWEITFTDREDIGKSLARVTYSIVGRWARFAYSKKRPMVNRTNVSAKQSARHEFGHFILARMEHFAFCRFVTESEIEEESESFARVIEKLCG